MKVKNRRLCAAASAAMLTGSLFGCAGNRQIVTEQHRQQTVISFSWWGNDPRNEYTIEAIRQFEVLHPEIRVDVSYSEWSGYEARSRVRMNSNTEADVMQINFDWLSTYSPDGTGYYDLEQHTDILDLNSYTAEQLEYGRRNGILNALPIAMNTETIYINQTIYETYGLDVPQTWDDLFAAAKVMKPDGVYPMAGAQKSIWLFLLAYGEQTAGKTLLREDGSLQFTAKDFQVMLEMYRDMVNEGVIPQPEYFVRTELDNGTYAGAVGWVSDAGNYFSARITLGDRVVIANYTNLNPADSGKGWYAKPATLYAVSKDTEQPEEAILLLNYLVNSQEMALLQGVEKGIPLSAAAKGYLEEEGMLDGIQNEASEKMEATEGMISMQPYLENASVIDAFSEACNQVLFDKATPADAAKEFHAFAAAAIK